MSSLRVWFTIHSRTNPVTGSVTVPAGTDVDGLKDAIKAKMSSTLSDIDGPTIKIFKARKNYDNWRLKTNPPFASIKKVENETKDDVPLDEEAKVEGNHKDSALYVYAPKNLGKLNRVGYPRKVDGVDWIFPLDNTVRGISRNGDTINVCKQKAAEDVFQVSFMSAADAERVFEQYREIYNMDH